MLISLKKINIHIKNTIKHKSLMVFFCHPRFWKLLFARYPWNLPRNIIFTIDISALKNSF